MADQQYQLKLMMREKEMLKLEYFALKKAIRGGSDAAGSAFYGKDPSSPLSAGAQPPVPGKTFEAILPFTTSNATEPAVGWENFSTRSRAESQLGPERPPSHRTFATSSTALTNSSGATVTSGVRSMWPHKLNSE